MIVTDWQDRLQFITGLPDPAWPLGQRQHGVNGSVRYPSGQAPIHPQLWWTGITIVDAKITG